MKITCLGHASFLIETADKRIYLDPHALTGEPEAADLILISHDHFDHCDIGSIKKIKKPGTHILGPESVNRKIPSAGILRQGDKIRVGGLKVEAFHSYSISKDHHPKGDCIAFIIESEGRRVYHAGDTEVIPEMCKLKKIDVALLPIDGRYTMDVDDAVEAVKIIRPEIAVPMHYGITCSRLHADRFKEKVEKETKTKAEILEKRPLEI